MGLNEKRKEHRVDCIGFKEHFMQLVELGYEVLGRMPRNLLCGSS
jgi:hypothetical protein